MFKSKKGIKIMLGNNIKNLRKQKGFTQEELAIRLNVVRQTVSKWEKGYSVPDADILEKISDVFEVTVGDLLGKEVYENRNADDITIQLSRINEQLAIKNSRTKKVLKIIRNIVIGMIIIFLIIILMNIAAFQSFSSSESTVESIEIIDQN